MEPLKENPCKKITEASGTFLNALYKNDFPKVKWMVKQNSGSEQEASDIFQESMMVIFQECRDGKLNLTANLSTYLYSIARNKWLGELKKRERIVRLKDAEEIHLQDDNIRMDDDTNKQKQRLFATYFTKLSDKCQQCLIMYFEGVKGEEISRQLGFNSYEYYRVAKSRCMESLKKMIRDDAVFQEIKR